LFVGKRLPIIIVAFLIISITVTVFAVYSHNKPETETATVFVTVKGLGDKDFENRRINVEEGESVANAFSLKYEEIYNDFGKPLIRYNEFYSFLGVKKTAEKSFHVTIDGRFDSNLDQAYLYHGQKLEISYY
jgi:hypothetical protein